MVEFVLGGVGCGVGVGKRIWVSVLVYSFGIGYFFFVWVVRRVAIVVLCRVVGGRVYKSVVCMIRVWISVLFFYVFVLGRFFEFRFFFGEWEL